MPSRHGVKVVMRTERMLGIGVMRRWNLLAAVVVLAAGMGSGVVSCAFNYDLMNCDDYPMPGCPGVSTDGGSDGNNADCSGDPTTDPAIVTDACGVFVSANAASGGDGSQAKPFQTFAEAAAAKPARVFACAGMYTETMQVSFSGGVEVYGGFTGCTATSWTWSASVQAEIATVAGVPGVVLDGGANKLENVKVTAPDVPMTMLGGSSIAVLVNGGSLDMTNGTLTSGDAQDGAAGTSMGADPTLDGTTGATGEGACGSGATHPGATGQTNTCMTGGTTTAGNGADGGDATGDPAGSGANGSAMPPATASGTNDGKGGAGETSVLCANGDNGAPGSTGNSGTGAAGIGMLTKTGYEGVAGADGKNGAPGQGGGGGGSAKGAAMVTCGSMTNAVFGASGGAGGTGGCGGNAGGGGQAGGSSIALLVLGAEVTLASVTLTAGKGGNGGVGGNGQSGGNGGNGGTRGDGESPANPSCAGGDGGQGGGGGPGGGGQGGHSLGIAFQGTTAPVGGKFMIGTMNNGMGGAGGTNNTMAGMGAGVPGMAENCWDFGTNKACM
jgi:hypothetical protein